MFLVKLRAVVFSFNISLLLLKQLKSHIILFTKELLIACMNQNKLIFLWIVKRINNVSLYLLTLLCSIILFHVNLLINHHYLWSLLPVSFYPGYSLVLYSITLQCCVPVLYTLHFGTSTLSCPWWRVSTFFLILLAAFMRINRMKQTLKVFV